MMSTTEAESRAPHKARQRTGAAHDSPNAPARDLVWARRGTAFFTRKLGELSDADLGGPSLLTGWSNSALIAHVGYNARALCRLLQWARTGVETSMYASAAARDTEINSGATLPARALRTLIHHTNIHLNVEWRDLPDQAWDRPVRTAQGRTVAARETAWMRTREVWVHAVDLGNGASFHDFPAALLDELLLDVLRAWERRGDHVDVTLISSDHGARFICGDDGGPTVTGSTADLVAWLTGRRGRHLSSSTGTIPTLPRWP